MTGNELLREALMLSLEETIAFHKHASKENPHRFSLAYKIRRRSIIRLAERREADKKHRETEKPRTERHFMPLKRLELFMAIIAAAVIFSVGAYAVYLVINGFSFDVHEEYSRVTLDIAKNELKDTISELYWIPPESGWEKISEMSNSNLAMSHYQQNGHIILLIQYTKFAAEHFLKFNTEDTNIYGVKINGNDGFIDVRLRENLDDEKEIIWVTDGYIFHISGWTVTDEELIKLAESVTIREILE